MFLFEIVRVSIIFLQKYFKPDPGSMWVYAYCRKEKDIQIDDKFPNIMKWASQN